MAASADRLVPMMAFCEAPFDGTLDGTSAPDRGGAASKSSPGDAAASRSELSKVLMEIANEIAKEFAKPSQSQPREQAQQQQQEKADAVDGLAIFETVVLQ